MQRAARGAGGGRGGPRPGAPVRSVAEAAKAKAPGLGGGPRPGAPVRPVAEAVKAKAKRSSNLFIELAQGKDKQTISSYQVRPGLGGAAAAAAAAGLLLGSGPAAAELNRLEYERGGEFNRGTAMQFGGTDMIKVDIAKQYGNDLRLSNFVQADIRGSKLRNTNLKGAYMMKLVAPEVDFTGSDMSDALMDRSVFVDADFTNAILSRVVLTLSDLTGATVTGADFSDALLDKPMQTKLCAVASGTNPVTGVDTRKSLKCGSSRFAARQSSPSAYMTDDSSQKPMAEFEPDRFSMYTTKPEPLSK